MKESISQNLKKKISGKIFEQLRNGTVKELFLNMGKIPNHEIYELCELLKINSSLVSIDFTGSSIGDEGVKHLSEVLKINSTLTSIKLRRNQISDEGAKSLSEALKINSVITSIDLGDNQIGEEGGYYLSEAFKINSTLTSINLQYNQIGDAGAKHLSESLKINTSLTSIYLEFNQLSYQGLIDLRKAINFNRSLTHLSFQEIRIQPSVINKFSLDLKRHQAYIRLIKDYKSFLNTPYDENSCIELKNNIQDFSKKYPRLVSDCEKLLENLNHYQAKSYSSIIQKDKLPTTDINTKEDQFMNERLTFLAVEIKKLKNQQLEFQKVIDEIPNKKQEIEQLHLLLENQKEEIQLLKNQNQQLEEINRNLQKNLLWLETLNSNRLEILKTEVKEISYIQNAIPKFIDILVTQGNLHELQKRLGNPELYDLKGLSLIPFQEALESETLKAHGAIMTWNALQIAIEEVKNAPRVSRRYLKRLHSGLMQLEKAWRSGTLQNKEVQIQLDEILFNILGEALDQHEKFPYLENKKKQLREKKFELWFKDDENLSSKQREKWDRLLCNQILFQYVSEKDEKNAFSTLQGYIQLSLVERFKYKVPEELPQSFRNALNQESLSALIYEQIGDLPKVLQKEILSEITHIKYAENNGYDHNKSDLQKKAINQVCSNWFNNKITEQKVSESLDKLAGKLLGKVSFDGHGTLHTRVKSEAVFMLLKHWKTNSLKNMIVEEALEGQAKHTILNDTLNEEEKIQIQEEILNEFKAGKLEDEQLSEFCLKFIRKPMQELQLQLEFQTHKDPTRFFAKEKNLEENIKNSISLYDNKEGLKT